MEKRGKILVVDDNEDILFALNTLLSKHVEKIKVTTKPNMIEHFLLSFEPDVILLDMNYEKDASSGKEGIFWLQKILEIVPSAIVILITAYVDTSKAVEAIKKGATDYITKPWDNEKLLATVLSAIKMKSLQTKAEFLEEQLTAVSTLNSFTEIIGASDKMLQVFELVERVAPTEANVLILGENGTGKDLIAQTIHQLSARQKKVFSIIDLGSISDSLFEGELFGYEKGAFTDAKRSKYGRIEIASGGTLFLDEIGNLSLAMQSKLLTAIEKRVITRLGAVKTIPVDVRFVTATNANIYTMVNNGTFRQDLLYRINTVEITIPPLRERGNDILLLATYFMQRFNQKYKKNVKSIPMETQKVLLNYTWPGNVRELQNVVERAVILSNGTTLECALLNLQTRITTTSKDELNLGQLEIATIEKALEKTQGNLNKAAELLGISRFALYRKMNKR